MRKTAKDLIERNKRLSELLDQPLSLSQFTINYGELPKEYDDQDGDYFFGCPHADLVMAKDRKHVLCTKCDEVFEESSCEL